MKRPPKISIAVLASWHGDAFCVTNSFLWGIHKSPVDSPHNGTVVRALMFSFMLACWNNYFELSLRFQTTTLLWHHFKACLFFIVNVLICYFVPVLNSWQCIPHHQVKKTIPRCSKCNTEGSKPIYCFIIGCSFPPCYNTQRNTRVTSHERHDGSIDHSTFCSKS